MEVRLIARPNKTGISPQLEAVRFARENGFELRREPFGRRGSLIEIYRDGEDLGYRKSYAAALTFMRKQVAA